MMTKLSNNEIMHVHTFNISGVNNNSLVCGRWNDAALVLSLMPNKFFNLLLKFSSFAISLSSHPSFISNLFSIFYTRNTDPDVNMWIWIGDLHVLVQFYQFCRINAFHLLKKNSVEIMINTGFSNDQLNFDVCMHFKHLFMYITISVILKIKFDI